MSRVRLRDSFVITKDPTEYLLNLGFVCTDRDTYLNVSSRAYGVMYVAINAGARSFTYYTTTTLGPENFFKEKELYEYFLVASASLKSGEEYLNNLEIDYGCNIQNTCA